MTKSRNTHIYDGQSMQLKSIETTPNPNSMKLNMDGAFPKTVTYTGASKEGCPPFVEKLLTISGVKSVFVCNDFLTLNRDPLSDWKTILEEARNIFGDAVLAGKPAKASEQNQAERSAAAREGQVQILVQTFRNIPIQVKAVAVDKEVRVSLGERFDQAAREEQIASNTDFLKERFWADHGVRYGGIDEIAAEVADELRNTFDFNALDKDKTPPEKQSSQDLAIQMSDQNWHQRLLAVQALSQTSEIDLLIRALQDPQHQVRRLAAAALGASGDSAAVAPLCATLLEDQSVGVRRTAGDALSDIGDVSAQAAVCKALSDPNKLVRWRAARFLCDLGTAGALVFLENAATADEPAFEVRLEIEAAIERIKGGGQGIGPAWKRIIE